MSAWRHKIGFLMLAAAFVCSGSARGEPHAEFDSASGLFRVMQGGAPVVEAQFVFWRGEWSWQDASLSVTTREPRRRYAFRSAVPDSFVVTGEAEIFDGGKATWTMRVEERTEVARDVFGGIVFRITPDALRQDGFEPRAEINPDKKSWSLRIAPGEPPLVVSFEGPIHSLEYEMGNHGEIRAYLLGRNDEADAVDVHMTLSFPGTFRPDVPERLAAKSDTWWSDDVHWNRSPVDLSFLNASEKPAGKRGFLRAVGEDLVFEDGTKAYFWGTNLTAFALFQRTTPLLVCNQAQRLSKLGFNLVRIHHHDSDWVSPNIFGAEPASTRELNAASLEKIDWWIKCLRDEGIYIWLDLHVGRRMTGSDGVEAFEEIADPSRKTADPRGYMYVNDSLKARAKEFAEAYLTHVNQYTGIAYKDDPAIVAVLITNENDLTHHFGNALLPDKNVPWHNARYMKLAGAFASRSGLDFEQVWRSWEFGPSKIFLADLEHAFLSDMTRYVRDVGVKVPVVPTNYWGDMSAAGLTALGEGDIVDAHAYGRANEVEKNPREAASLVSWLAGGALINKPYSVSEWNVEPFPAFDRAQVPLHVASIARLQGWNAMIQYAYTQSPLTGMAGIGNWEASSDPSMIATLPAAALLFRGGHVSPARESYELAVSEDVFTGQEINARTSRAIRTLTETSKIRLRVPAMKALDWITDQPSAENARRISDPGFDAIGVGVDKVCSDTGEICRDWVAGILTVDTAKSQIASGWLGGREVALGDVTVALSTPNASVAVQSLDQAPLAASGRIMISLAAQSIPNAGRLPFNSEPVEGEIRIRARSGLKAYAADRDGALHPIRVEASSDGYTVPLTPEIRSHWLFLQPPAAAEPGRDARDN